MTQDWRFVFEDIKITKELTNRNEKLDEDSKNYLHGGHERSKRSAGSDIKMTSNNKDNKHSPPESTEEEIARCFHAMSITIVLILLTEVRNPSNSSHLRKWGLSEFYIIAFLFSVKCQSMIINSMISIEFN